uniref:Uncharacterized protein n=1 Tax=Heterorhabditis bacteriophora TaxID=37862 RepID=A0A1I7XV83_HETBA
MGNGEGFCIGDSLISEVKRERVYNYPPAALPTNRSLNEDMHFRTARAGRQGDKTNASLEVKRTKFSFTSTAIYLKPA